MEVNDRTELGGEIILPTQRQESRLIEGICSWEGRQIEKKQRPQSQTLTSEQTQKESGKKRDNLKTERAVQSGFQNDNNKIK